MADVQRHLGDPDRPKLAAVDSAQVIEIGDLLYLATDDARAAAQITYGASLVITQRAFALLFLGVAESASASGETAAVRYGTAGVYTFPCASATFEIGDMIGVDDNAGGTALTSQQVIAVTDPQAAIGIVAEREASAVTAVKVELFSRYAHFRAGGYDDPTGDMNLLDDIALVLGTGNDIDIAWDGTKLAVTQAAVNSAIHFGIDGAGIDLNLFGDTASSTLTWDQSADKLIFNGSDLLLQDADILEFGDASDLTMTWDGTNFIIDALTADSGIGVGVDGAGLDFKLFGDTASSYMEWDQSADKLIFDGADLGLLDADILEFGDAQDITMTWDATQFVIDAATADSAIHIGVDGAGLDLKLFGDTASSYCLWDQSTDTLELDGADVLLKDSDILQFGDAKDATMTWDGTQFVIDALTADSAIHIGVDGAGLDVKFFGDTASSYMLWDQSADALIINAGTADLGTSCEADAYTVGGVAGVDHGPADITSITVVKGIVTAVTSV